MKLAAIFFLAVLTAALLILSSVSVMSSSTAIIQRSPRNRPGMCEIVLASTLKLCRKHVEAKEIWKTRTFPVPRIFRSPGNRVFFGHRGPILNYQYSFPECCKVFITIIRRTDDRDCICKFARDSSSFLLDFKLNSSRLFSLFSDCGGSISGAAFQYYCKGPKKFPRFSTPLYQDRNGLLLESLSARHRCMNVSTSSRDTISRLLK